jgi:hypothetical protein
MRFIWASLLGPRNLHVPVYINTVCRPTRHGSPNHPVSTSLVTCNALGRPGMNSKRIMAYRRPDSHRNHHPPVVRHEDQPNELTIKKLWPDGIADLHNKERIEDLQAVQYRLDHLARLVGGLLPTPYGQQ